MKHAHTLAAIDAAEMRMEISRREMREGWHRVERAFRETVTRPSTLAAAGGIAGLAGLAGFLIARRPKPRVRYASPRYTKAGAGVIVASSLAAIGRLLMSRYGVKGLTLVMRQLRKRWERRNAASAYTAAAGTASHSTTPASHSTVAESRYAATTGDSSYTAPSVH
jgi:hypothetical protein